MDDNEQDQQQKHIFLIIISCQGLFGACIGCFMVLFVASLKDKKPPDFILLGICTCDMILCLSDTSQFYFRQYPDGLGCRLVGVVQYSFASTIMITPIFGMFNRYFSIELNFVGKVFVVKWYLVQIHRSLPWHIGQQNLHNDHNFSEFLGRHSPGTVHAFSIFRGWHEWFGNFRHLRLESGQEDHLFNPVLSACVVLIGGCLWIELVSWNASDEENSRAQCKCVWWFYGKIPTDFHKLLFNYMILKHIEPSYPRIQRNPASHETIANVAYFSNPLRLCSLGWHFCRYWPLDSTCHHAYVHNGTDFQSLSHLDQDQALPITYEKVVTVRLLLWKNGTSCNSPPTCCSWNK